MVAPPYPRATYPNAWPPKQLKCFSYISSESLLSQFKAITSGPLPAGMVEEPGPHLTTTSNRELWRSTDSTLLESKQTQLSQLVLIRHGMFYPKYKFLNFYNF